MFLQSSKLASVVLAGVLVVGAVHWHRAEAGAGINFCVDSASPLAASGKRLAHAVAQTQGFKAVVHTFNGNGHGDDPFEMFGYMAARQCALILGFPVAHANPSIPDGVKATAPYAHTGFVLVTRNKLPASLNAFPKGTTVALVWSTVPNLYVLSHKNLASDVYRLTRGALDALANKKDDAAMVWQPALAAYEKNHPQAKQWPTRILDQPHAQWNLVALYDPQSANAAKVFEKGMAKLAANGKLKAILAPLGVAGQHKNNQSKGERDANDRGGDQGASAADSAAHSNQAAANQDPKSQDSTGHDTAGEPRANNAGKDKSGGGASKNGLFTARQASQGHGVYAQHCAQCHGGQLEGQVGPALKGSVFAGKGMGITVGDMFGFMAQQMPAGMGGSLSHKDYAQVMAFILKKNGYKPGKQPLTYARAQQSKAPLVSKVQ